MTWINPPPPEDPHGIRAILAPRDIDAVGLALAAAFEKPIGLPTDLWASLRALEHIN